MGSLISIIVPIYKVEMYLERCVSSLLNQTYTNIEIILIDDGSPDQSPRLCEELKQKDNRIVVVHKENGGLSSARNAGIHVAKGEYIAFVDSDDYIAENMIERMYQTIEQDKSDLCICDFCLVDDKGAVLEKTEGQFPFGNRVLSKDEVLKILCGVTRIENDWRIVPAWNKLYRRHIWENCRFEEGRLHEDEFAIHHVLSECKTISLIAEKLYYYVQRENSIMNSQFSIKRFDAAFAFKNRYMFMKAYDKAMGISSLMLFCEYLALNLYKFDVKKHKKIIRPVVCYVIKELIIHGKLGYAKWLILSYFETTK